MRARVLVLVPLLMGLGGCGSAAAKKQASPTTTVPAATTTTLSKAEIDKAKAKSLVLTAADLPGFTTKAPTPDDNADPLNTCARTAPMLSSAVDSPNDAPGDDFERGADGAVAVGSDGDVLDPVLASTYLKELAGPSLAACFQRVIKAEIVKGLPKGVTATISVVPGTAPVAGAEQAVSLDIKGKVSGGSVALLIRLRLDVLRKQGAIVSLSYAAFGVPFDQAEHDRLLALLASRL